MTQQTKTNLIIRSSIVLALVLVIWIPMHLAQSAEAAGGMMMGGKMMAMDGKSITDTNMMQDCQKMMDQKQKMTADIAAQDAGLTTQLAEMNRAPDDKKMGLMAAVLTQMVGQRITMDARKAKMEDAMMQHMMQHMQMGMGSMSQCPMMKGMKGMDEKPDGAPMDHSEMQK